MPKLARENDVDFTDSEVWTSEALAELTIKRILDDETRDKIAKAIKEALKTRKAAPAKRG